MTRIKSFWFKKSFQDYFPGVTMVCENGTWRKVWFWWSDEHMRWERAD